MSGNEEEQDSVKSSHTDEQSNSSKSNNEELIEELMHRILPTLNTRLDESLARNFANKHNDGPSSSDTRHYVGDHTYIRKDPVHDDALSLVAPSLEDNGSLGFIPPHPSKYSPSTASSGSKRIHTGQVNPGEKRLRTSNDTVVNCDDNGQVKPYNAEDQPDDVDVCEEILRRCDEGAFSQEVGPEVHSALGKRVLKYWEKGADNSENRRTLFKKYLTPGNLTSLDPPKLNEEVKTLKTFQYFKENERKLYDIQQNVSKACFAIVDVLEKTLNSERENRVVDSASVVQGSLHAISLLGHSSREISDRRKKNIKYCLNNNLAELCSSTRPTTKWLLGDDLSKGAKEAKELASLGKKLTGKSQQSSYKTSNSQSYSSKKENTAPKDYSKKSFLGKSKRTPHKKKQ